MKPPLHTEESETWVYLCDTDGTVAKVAAEDKARADFEEIARRVNAFDALVASAESNKRVMRHLETCPACGLSLSCRMYDLMEKEAGELTDDALALAKEQQ